VPVYHGHVLPHAVVTGDVAGRELSQFLAALLTQRGHYYDYNATADRRIVADIKCNLCYVALDVTQEKPRDCIVPLPDARELSLRGSERFRVPEALFNPESIGRAVGLQTMSFRSIMLCDADLQKELFSNVLICGGTSCFPGLSERLTAELTALASPAMPVSAACETMPHSAWRGGSMLAGLELFPQMCITPEEYGELGPVAIHIKC